MDIAFRDVIGHSVVVYLADVVVFSKKIKAHMFHLKHIFNHCKKYGISLNPKKCVFVVLKEGYHGHIISKKGTSIDPERMEAFAKIPLTNNKKGMQSFMGTINFVPRFVLRFCSNSQAFATYGQAKGTV